ncbi:MAG: response regulator [Sedimentisphaerales bacterium]|nr:response regulator [Sedimentisphaerales bacterium]
MNPKIKALVVEDDLEIREEIEDVLGLLDHNHVWAESQQEAREALEQERFQYALVDLEIPARTGRGFAKIEYGRKLIDQIQQIKGRGVLPVIVMTGHHKQGLDLVRELLGNGAMDFISKPFGDGASGKSLSQVIQSVLEKHRNTFPPGTLPADPPMDFRGGTLSFYADHIELNGVIILESDASGHSWKVMQVLRTPRPNGKLPHLSAPKLANKVDPTGQLTEGAVASCIHDMREKICNTMSEKANVTVGREGVITNRNKGYHLAEWLIIENHDVDPPVPNMHSPLPNISPANTPLSDTTSTEQELLSERQRWILNQLQQGVKLTRDMVEKQFGIKDKQAKRELAVLSKQGMIEFIRKPRPGYYVFFKKTPGGSSDKPLRIVSNQS